MLSKTTTFELYKTTYFRGIVILNIGTHSIYLCPLVFRKKN